MEQERQRRGPYQRGIERRREIVSVATEVFGEHGFKGGTLQRVADRVGVTTGAILKLFGTKEQLLIAVLENWDTVTKTVIVAESTGVARLEGFRRLMHYHVEHRGLLDLYVTMAAEATAPDHPAHDFMRNRYRKSLLDMQKLFRDAVAEGDFAPMSESEVEAEASFLLATMDGLEIRHLLATPTDLVAAFDVYVESLIARRAAHPAQ